MMRFCSARRFMHSITTSAALLSRPAACQSLSATFQVHALHAQRMLTS